MDTSSTEKAQENP
jgi:hypothetical protein